MDFLFNIGQSIFFFARTRTRIEKIQPIFIFGLALFVLSTGFAAAPKKWDAQTTQEIQNITNSQTQICLPAIDALGHSNNAQVVQPLSIAFSQETRPVVRRYIVDALGNLRNHAALPTLKLALQDQDLQVRQSAVAAVGLLSPTDVQETLIAQAAIEKIRR